MNSYGEFHANKNERLKSFKNTVKNIFDEKLKQFGHCFEKAKNPGSITHIQILDNYGRYYFIKVHNCFKDDLHQFDKDGRDPLISIVNLKSLHKDEIEFRREYITIYYPHFILFRTVSLKNSKNLMCNQNYELDQDLKRLVDEEELRYYLRNTQLFRLNKSL